jgi:hypothetical protein
LMDYGHPVQFGVFLTPDATQPNHLLELAALADNLGLELIGVQDHPYQRRFLDTWSLIPALLAETNRISFFTDVANLPLRPPAVMAKAAASLDVLGGGRFELGLGAGWYRPEYDAAGIPFDPPGQRISRLEESLAIIDGLLDRRPVHHQGPSYRVDGLDLDVLPAQHGRPRLLIGAGGPRMLRIAILRSAAGDRFGRLELSTLATFTVTSRRRAGTEELIASRGWAVTDVETVWDMPSVFIGSAAQIRDDLRARRDRFGLSYLVSSDRDLPALAEIIAGL